MKGRLIRRALFALVASLSLHEALAQGPGSSTTLMRIDREGIRATLDGRSGLTPLAPKVSLRVAPDLGSLDLPRSAMTTVPAEGEIGVTTFRSMQLGLDKVFYQNRDGHPVFEGDIVLGTMEDVSEVNAVDSRAYQSPFAPQLFGLFFERDDTVWYSGEIPYCLMDGFELPKNRAVGMRLHEAIEIWNETVGTIVRFVPAGEGKGLLRCPGGESKKQSRVRFSPYEKIVACMAQAGRYVGREQWVWLHPDCELRPVLHELGHVAGMLHEHSRKDRDGWVEVIPGNIDPKFSSAFSQKHVLPTAAIGEYDYASLMHYPVDAFSKKKGSPTLHILRAVKPGVNIGQDPKLSDIDIAALSAKYKNAKKLKPYLNLPTQ